MVQIEIDIKLPEGYENLKYGPLYLPPNRNHLILIGKAWVEPGSVMDYGGSYWLYVTKKRKEL